MHRAEPCFAARSIGPQGAEFDQNYLTYEVNRHSALPEQVRDLLRPSANAPELRDLIDEMHAVVEEPLNQVRQLTGRGPPAGRD